MLKKILSLLLILTLLISMVGCDRRSASGETGNPTSTGNTTGESESNTTETEPDEPPPPLNLPYNDSDLVLVKECLPQLVIDLKYATEDNFTGKTVYSFQDVYLRYGTIKKLHNVCHALAKQGLYIKIWDGFRPVSAQFKLWALYPNADYVTNPDNGFSSHSRGNTLDITLVDAQGKELEMPSKYDDFSQLADRDYSDCTPAAANNAKLLQNIMEKNGFTGYTKEWWNFADSTQYPVEMCFDPAVISLWYADCNDSINMRAAPNIDGKLLGTIPAKGKMTLLGWSGTYGWVDYQGQRGYVSAGYIQPVKEDIVWTPICNEYINMRKTPGGDSIITRIPVGASLSLDKWYGKYALVTYLDKQGYVLSNYIKPTDEQYIPSQLSVITPTTKYSYQQMLEDLQKLQALYPDLVHTDVIGKSELGRDIPVLQIGNPDAEYHVLMQGAMHGREHFSAWLLTALADFSLSRNYLASGNVCYHIIPMSNPDGVIISQSKQLDSTQTAIYQNDRATGYTSYGKSTYAEQWKANGLGVDLNRNFSSGWANSLERPVPSSEKYRGSEPFSAAESRALRDYTMKYNFDVTISVHSSGSVIYYQYGNKQPVNRLSLALAQSVEKETGYRPMRSDGTTGAGYKDWAMDALGIPSLTLEIGCSTSPMEERDIYNTFSRCQNLLPAISAWLLRK